MSKKQRPHYPDKKSVVTESFDGKGLISEGTAVPADGSPGYSPGGLFFKRGGAPGAQMYVNEGTNAASSFKPLPASGVAPAVPTSARGIAAVTGTLTVATGLASVTAVVATLATDASLGGTVVTATIGDQVGAPAAGSVILKAWKPTGAQDGTMIAATVPLNVNWIAVGP